LLRRSCLGGTGRNAEESSAALALLLWRQALGGGLPEGACLGLRFYSPDLPLADGALCWL